MFRAVTRDADRVVDVDLLQHVRVLVRAADLGAAAAVGVAAPPLVRERGRSGAASTCRWWWSACCPPGLCPRSPGGDWFTGAACGAAPPISARPATAASTTSVPTSADQNSFDVRFMEKPLSIGGSMSLRRLRAERHGPGGPAGLQNRPGRATHGLLGSTPGPLRELFTFVNGLPRSPVSLPWGRTRTVGLIAVCALSPEAAGRRRASRAARRG